MNYDKYITKAYEMGATTAKVFSIDQIVFDPRTILKCKYGCEDYGKLHNCPSDSKSLGIEENIRIFKHYKSGIIIHCHDKKPCQHISFEIERMAFLDGHYFALSLSDCGLCTECKEKSGKSCAFPKMARPAFHSIGVDVFLTVNKLGMPLYPLKNQDDEQNWYSAIFIE